MDYTNMRVLKNRIESIVDINNIESFSELKNRDDLLEEITSLFIKHTPYYDKFLCITDANDSDTMINLFSNLLNDNSQDNQADLLEKLKENAVDFYLNDIKTITEEVIQEFNTNRFQFDYDYQSDSANQAVYKRAI